MCVLVCQSALSNATPRRPEERECARMNDTSEHSRRGALRVPTALARRRRRARDGPWRRPSSASGLQNTRKTLTNRDHGLSGPNGITSFDAVSCSLGLAPCQDAPRTTAPLLVLSSLLSRGRCSSRDPILNTSGGVSGNRSLLVGALSRSRARRLKRDGERSAKGPEYGKKSWAWFPTVLF